MSPLPSRVREGSFASPLNPRKIGDTVNRAAKLQNQTKAEAVQALTTLTCRDLAIAQGYNARRVQRELPARAVGGVAEPMDLAVVA